MYNCAFTNVEKIKDFADVLFLLCNGCGCGFSVQKRHIEKLPIINGGHAEVMEIPDTKEGWADSVVRLIENPDIVFEYGNIRPLGASLSTGGTASGPETLKMMHEQLRSTLKKAIGRKLRSIEVHDMMCQIGDLIVSGGCRRSAMISLFDCDDEEMMECKSGWEWFQTSPWRARSNNSAVLVRSSPTFKSDMEGVIRKCFKNGTGEPGIFLTNDADYGTNPCAEISLKSKQLCNLTEVNMVACNTGDEFIQAVRGATALGTIQASYTDFKYIQDEWKQNCEQDALLGVSLTGIAQKWELLHNDGGLLLERAGQVALEENIKWAQMLGINPAKRIGCVKPSGTTSALLGTTSGIHAAHAELYLRRVRMETNSPLSHYFVSLYGQRIQDMEQGVQMPTSEVALQADKCAMHVGKALIESDVYSRKSATSTTIGEKGEQIQIPHTLVVTMPVKMQDSIVRSHESAVQLLNRASFIHEHFIQKSHRDGPNYHNVSLTVNYKARKVQMVKKIEQDKEIEQEVVIEEGEEEQVLQWIFAHTDKFSGIALFPDMSGGVTYPQTPFEEIDQNTFNEWEQAWIRLGEIAKDKIDYLSHSSNSSSSSSFISPPISTPYITSEQQSPDKIEDQQQNETTNEQSTQSALVSALNATEEHPHMTLEECMNILKIGMERVAWDPHAIDKRKEVLSCAGGNCEVI